MSTDVILDLSELGVEFSTPTGLFRRTRISAVDKVSIKINRGESVGFVGESGSGKTTIARCIVKLIEPTSGHIFFNGQDIFEQNSRESKEYRKHVQMVFQDPYESLNPRSNISQIVEEPLIVHRISPDKESRRERSQRTPFARGSRKRSGKALSARAQRRTAAASLHRQGSCSESRRSCGR